MNFKYSNQKISEKKEALEQKNMPTMLEIKAIKGPLQRAFQNLLEEDDVKDFGKLLEISDALNRSIIIEEIDEESGVVAENLIRFWNKLDDEMKIPTAERQPIKIYIDSPGGYINPTFTIIDSIRLSKTPIWTINIGCAYSGGFFIFISGHKRIAYPLSSFLYHEGAATIGGDANKFQNQADFYKNQRKKLKEITLKYTKITEGLYNEHIKDDWWLFADEAKELGIVDEIASEFV